MAICPFFVPVIWQFSSVASDQRAGADFGSSA